MDRVRLRSEITNLWVIIGALVAIILGLLIFELTSTDQFSWNSIFQNFAAFLIGTATVTLLWEGFAKRSFFREILAAVRLSSNIRDAGIKRFSLDYKEFDWKELFKEANHIDVFFSYGKSWRNNYVEQVKAFARRDNVHMRVLLPDYQQDPLVSRLADRFETDPERVKELIKDAEAYFRKHFSNGTGLNDALELRLTEQSPQYAYYRFDRTAIITFFNHLGRTGKIPSFSMSKGGDLYEFASEEFNELFESARRSQTTCPSEPTASEHATGNKNTAE